MSTTPNTIDTITFDINSSEKIEVSRVSPTKDQRVQIYSDRIRIFDSTGTKPDITFHPGGIEYLNGPGAARTNNVHFRNAIYLMPKTNIGYFVENESWEMTNTVLSTPEIFTSDIPNGQKIAAASVTYTDTSGEKHCSPAQLTYIADGATYIEFGLMIRGGVTIGYRPDPAEDVELTLLFDANY